MFIDYFEDLGLFSSLWKLISPQKLETWEGFRFGKKIISDTDTEIGPWFWFRIPKPGFGCTLVQRLAIQESSTPLTYYVFSFLLSILSIDILALQPRLNLHDNCQCTIHFTFCNFQVLCLKSWRLKVRLLLSFRYFS